jgi:hypothetical protein
MEGTTDATFPYFLYSACNICITAYLPTEAKRNMPLAATRHCEMSLFVDFLR